MSTNTSYSYITRSIQNEILGGIEKKNNIETYFPPLLNEDIEKTSINSSVLNTDVLYINISEIYESCKKDVNKFNNWLQSDRTKIFLQVLSETIGLHIDDLIKTEIDDNGINKIMVHPLVSINIGQLLSPHFETKVACWVYDRMCK